MSVKKLTKIIRMLQLEEKASATQIASQIKADKRTTKQMLMAATELGLVTSKSVEVSGRTYAAYRLSPEYKKIVSDKRWEKE